MIFLVYPPERLRLTNVYFANDTASINGCNSAGFHRERCLIEEVSLCCLISRERVQGVVYAEFRCYRREISQEQGRTQYVHGIMSHTLEDQLRTGSLNKDLLEAQRIGFQTNRHQVDNRAEKQYSKCISTGACENVSFSRFEQRGPI